ncbi:DUF2959 domain-containing protein [Paraglaciecola sp.]|uniref:DUF2959 domain-containing protein n=1 Tax=Paraglaciecola sp. TaxID=1920173 RepID=UPI0030F42681
MKIYLIIVLSLFLFSCQSAYYAAWEKVGVEKRDILIDRVEDAKDSQQDAQKQFSSALEQLTALIKFDGGELQEAYELLKNEYESSEKSAENVSARINKVEKVAEALFDEWGDELEKYSSATLRRDSKKRLVNTQQRYKTLLASMRKAEAKMPPVLLALRDNVLYLKHNLNANVIGSLQGEFSGIKSDVNQLIQEMNKAIKESTTFIVAMQQE